MPLHIWGWYSSLSPFSLVVFHYSTDLRLLENAHPGDWNERCDCRSMNSPRNGCEREGLLLHLTGHGLALSRGAPEDPSSSSLEVVVGRQWASQDKPGHVHYVQTATGCIPKSTSIYISIWLPQGSGEMHISMCGGGARRARQLNTSYIPQLSGWSTLQDRNLAPWGFFDLRRVTKWNKVQETGTGYFLFHLNSPQLSMRKEEKNIWNGNADFIIHKVCAGIAGFQ